ncbi:MAG: hypothetical protein JWO02_3660 [Solirubrobacterales bacterium]|nr:hypothetical protein [Solirubrobacterales bacterium]
MRRSRIIADDQGVATVIVAMVILVVALPFCVFAVDAANWFVHKRHLQTQADAAALAGAGLYRFPSCDNAPITAAALRYSGKGDGATTYNGTFPTVAPGRLHAVVNGPNYFGQSKPNEADLAGNPPPCTSKVVDVKMTETNLPFIFSSGLVSNINAQARVKLFQVSQADGMLPLGVQEAAPRKVRAYIVDEATGTTVKNPSGNDASVVLDAHGASGGLLQFDNESAPLAFTPPANVTSLGVRLALGGATSTTCLQPLVNCYDSATTQGLSYVRTWSDQGDPTSGQPPVARSVSFSPITCTNGSFSSAGSACTIAINAKVKWNPSVTASDLGTNTQLKAVYNGVTYTMAYSAATQTWTASSVSVPSGTIGPRTVNLDWVQKVGTMPNGNKTTDCTKSPFCSGTIANVQRTFWNNPDDQSSRGGPIGKLDVLNGLAGPQVSDLQRCSATHPNCTVNLVFEVGIKGALGLDKPTDPPRSMRVSGSGSQNQTLDCDPARGFVDEIAYGCQPAYGINGGTTCLPATTPLSCVPVGTGTTANKPAEGFNIRFLCAPPGNPGGCRGTPGNYDGKPRTCPPAGQFGHNNWPNYPSGDPRVVAVFLVPFGTFESSGNQLVPIIDFAAFYVTGYASNGAGFANPCIGNGDQFVPGTDTDNGVISGHFVKNVTPNAGGNSTDICDFNDIGECVAVLVK